MLKLTPQSETVLIDRDCIAMVQFSPVIPGLRCALLTITFKDGSIPVISLNYNTDEEAKADFDKFSCTN